MSTEKTNTKKSNVALTSDEMWSEYIAENSEFDGYIFNRDEGVIEKCAFSPRNLSDLDIAADEINVKSMLAHAMISQLIKNKYQGWVDYQQDAFVITLSHYSKPIVHWSYSRGEGGPLRFRSYEQAKDFLKRYERLVLDYFMVK